MGAIESGGISLALNEVRAERDRLLTRVEELEAALRDVRRHLENGMAASALATVDDTIDE